MGHVYSFLVRHFHRKLFIKLCSNIFRQNHMKKNSLVLPIRRFYFPFPISCHASDDDTDIIMWLPYATLSAWGCRPTWSHRSSLFYYRRADDAHFLLGRVTNSVLTEGRTRTLWVRVYLGPTVLKREGRDEKRVVLTSGHRQYDDCGHKRR